MALQATALMLMFFTALTAGQVQRSPTRVWDADTVVNFLREESNKWANAYLPTAVSPTSPCGRALQAMFNSLADNTTLWAAKMVDAWGKTSDGIFFGNWMRTGVYDECLSATSPDGRFSGKYCQVFTQVKEESKQRRQSLTLTHLPPTRHLTPTRPGKEPQTISDTFTIASVHYGTCMPDVCSEEELLRSVNLQNTIGTNITALVTCSKEEPGPHFTDADVGFTALLTFLMVLILCSSLIDIFLSYTGNKVLRRGALRYLLVFSAYTNLTKILQVNPVPSPGTITCLHGMRVLSMTWVLYSHQQGTTLFNTANLLDVGKWAEGLLAQTITNGYPSVDTFFFFSGLLVTYSVLRELGRRGRFNVTLYFIHRFIRLIPPIAIVAGLMATVLRFFASGPYNFKWTNEWQANCIKYWWKDVVFINNFLYEEGDCLAQAWYVAVDTQLYFIAPLVILPLFFYEAMGKAWLLIVTVVSAVIPAAIIYARDYPPTNLMYGPEGGAEYFMNIYLTPWCRAEPWVAGVWLGYIFYKQGDKRLKMSPFVVTVGWTVASLMGLLVVYGMYSYNSILHPVPYEVMTQIVYGGGHRLAWGAALAWLVLACHNGYGGIVDDFLSHPIWQPISRLTYSIYLVAFPMQFLLAYNLRVASYYSYINKIIETVGALVLAFPIAVLVSLMAESPVMGLERLLLRPGPRSPNTRTPANNTVELENSPDPDVNELTGGRHNPAFIPENSVAAGQKYHTVDMNSEYEKQKKIVEDTNVTSM